MQHFWVGFEKRAGAFGSMLDSGASLMRLSGKAGKAGSKITSQAGSPLRRGMALGQYGLGKAREAATKGSKAVMATPKRALAGGAALGAGGTLAAGAAMGGGSTQAQYPAQAAYY
jgi:hypothetical protein